MELLALTDYLDRHPSNFVPTICQEGLILTVS